MRYTLEYLDGMEGHDFEFAVADLLRHNGYRDVKVTQGSGDFGIDILARRKNVKYAIQCKRYKNAVGVKAVQEAGLGTDFYHCDAAAVITNSTFTKQAQTLAQTAGVRLWDRSFLEELINNYDDEYDEFDLLTSQVIVPETSTQSQSVVSTATKKDIKQLKVNEDSGFTKIHMSKVCTKCGREYGNSSVRCAICKIPLEKSGSGSSEQTKQENVRKVQTQSQIRHKMPQRNTIITQQIRKSSSPATGITPKATQKYGPSGLSITALIFSFFGCFSIVGFILGIVDLCINKQRKKVCSVLAIVFCGLWVAVSVGLIGENGGNSGQSIANNLIGTDAENIKEDIRKDNGDQQPLLSIPEQSTQESSLSMQDASEAFMPDQNATESTFQSHDIQETNISGQNSSGGNSIDFDEKEVYDEQSQQQEAESYTYIINTSTKYFHLPNGCKYINKYSDPEECITTNSSYDELRSQGYLPCKHCGIK